MMKMLNWKMILSEVYPSITAYHAGEINGINLSVKESAAAVLCDVMLANEGLKDVMI